MTDPRTLLSRYIEDGFIAGAGLIVRRHGEILTRCVLGYADMERKKALKADSLFRLASMSKPVTAVAVLQLIESGRVGLDDPLDAYLSDFSRMRVPEKPLTAEEEALAIRDPNDPAIRERMENMRYVPARKRITVRALLTHSCGMGMGFISRMFSKPCALEGDTLETRVKRYASVPLDFEPGTGTGYSGEMAFDVLARLVETVSGDDFDTYIRRHITGPLGIRDLGFRMDAEQLSRLVKLYSGETGTLRDVSETDDLWRRCDPSRGYFCGSAGMLGTLEAYDTFARMLGNGGELNGARVLTGKSVRMIRFERDGRGLNSSSGCDWGLGMLNFRGHSGSGRWLGNGTYGWSGAYGTHFYVDPVNDVTAVLMAQRSDIGGSGSPVSAAVEESVYRTYGLKEE